MFEGIDWILGGSFEGRIDTKDNANNKGSKEGNSKDFPANEWRERSKGGENKGKNVA